ncbi:MAG: hypothetical protein Q8916_13935 [Bacteroidota bacterium]|nr:hypothetical protein [Bacteroidota bacterium]MDP4237393.1 hypothetical protein [Bacteroidota bacterium]
MEVEIVDKYQGPEERKTITVWGDDGALCRPYLNQFKVGSYYVIAFFPNSMITIDTIQKPMKGMLTTSTSDYEISSCGTYWLSVDRSRKHAIGFLASTQHSVALKQLKKYFKKI